jgi:acetyl esterase/lipase
MTRRRLLAPLIGAPLVSAVMAACTPLALLERLGPRDRGARLLARDLPYGDDPRQTMDVYGPPGASRHSLPVVVFFYGGGWEEGRKSDYGWAAQALAARGFLVFLPDYRLVPQVHFPAFIEDAAQATARAAVIAGDHGGDPGHLAVAGHSAGAHLAMMIALDRRYMQAVGRPGLIKAAAGLAGPYEFLPFNVPAAVNAFGRAPDPTLTQPITFVRPDAPPVWLGHGTADVVVHDEDSILLDRALKQVGGASELKLYPGLDHADLIATFSPLFRRKAPVLDDLAIFLRQRLR